MKKKWYKVEFYTDNPEGAVRRLIGVEPRFFKGKISDVKLYHKKLSTKEVEKEFRLS